MSAPTGAVGAPPRQTQRAGARPYSAPSQRDGVRLSDDGHGRLARGLNPDEEPDRLIYMALTRAREAVFTI